jgi:hypothetical protein
MSEGLFITGTVSGRTKRMVGKDLSKELVTYKVMAGKKLYYVKDWESSDNYLQVGEVVTVPVSVKTYSSNGSTMLDFSIIKQDANMDIEF